MADNEETMGSSLLSAPNDAYAKKGRKNMAIGDML